MSHPIYKASPEQVILVGYDTTIPVRVLDAEGAALPLDTAVLSAEIDHAGLGTRAAPASVEVAGDVVLVRIAAADTQALAGRVGVLGVRLDLGAGVVYEVQAPVRGERGVAPPEPGSSYTTPGLAVTITGGEAPAVRAEWQAVRDLTAAIAAAEALQGQVDAALPQITGARDTALTQIGEARTGALSAIGQAGTDELTAIAQAGQDERAVIAQAGADAVQAVEEAETTTITQATQEGVQAVQQQQTQSVQAVADRQTQAEGAVDTRRDQALSAIQLQEAQSEAAVLAQEIASVAAVEEEGDAQEDRVRQVGNEEVGRVQDALGGVSPALLLAGAYTSQYVVIADGFNRDDGPLHATQAATGQTIQVVRSTDGAQGDATISGRVGRGSGWPDSMDYVLYPLAAGVLARELNHELAFMQRRSSGVGRVGLILAYVDHQHLIRLLFDNPYPLRLQMVSGGVVSDLATLAISPSRTRGMTGVVSCIHHGNTTAGVAELGLLARIPHLVESELSQSIGGDPAAWAIYEAATHVGWLSDRTDLRVEWYRAIRNP